MATPDWQTSWHESHKNMISDAEEVVHQDGHSLVSSADYRQLIDSAERIGNDCYRTTTQLPQEFQYYANWCRLINSLVYCFNSTLVFSIFSTLYVCAVLNPIGMAMNI